MFKDIKGFEGLYEINTNGLIKSKKGKNKGKILKAFINQNGYWRVTLTKNKHQQSYLVHRLVAQTFLENPYNLPQVNHKDSDRLNCKLENLEWISGEDNILYSYTHGKNKGKPIPQFHKSNLDSCIDFCIHHKITNFYELVNTLVDNRKIYECLLYFVFDCDDFCIVYITTFLDRKLNDDFYYINLKDWQIKKMLNLLVDIQDFNGLKKFSEWCDLKK